MAEWVEVSVVDDLFANDVRIEMLACGSVRVQLGVRRGDQTRIVGSFVVPPDVIHRLASATTVVHGLASSRSSGHH